MDWLQRLDVWVALFTLGALAWFELRLGRFVGPIVQSLTGAATEAAEDVKRRRKLPTTVRLKSRPVRRGDGRFNGSLPAVTSAGNDEQPSCDEVTALQREVTGGNDVAEVTVSFQEAALIAARLERGMSPSAVLKSLPGYSPKKNYDLYKAKVEQVRAALAELEPAEEAQEAS